MGATVEDLKDVYIKQVRSVLEFAVTALNGDLKHDDKQKIERVQRRHYTSCWGKAIIIIRLLLTLWAWSLCMPEGIIYALNLLENLLSTLNTLNGLYQLRNLLIQGKNWKSFDQFMQCIQGSRIVPSAT